MPTSKCFVRYNDSGNPYKVCIDKTKANKAKWDKSKAKSRKDKEPIFKKEPITKEEFVKKIGKGFAKMSPAQQNQYMKFNMRERRFKEKQKEQKAIKDFKKLKKELKEEKDKEVAKIKEKVEKEKPKKKASKGGDSTISADRKVTILSRALNAYRDGFNIDLKMLEKIIGTNNIKRFNDNKQDNKHNENKKNKEFTKKELLDFN